MTQWKPGEPVKIETERFLVRSLTPADAPGVYTGWWNDPEIQLAFNSKPRNWTPQQAARNIASFDNQTTFHLGIFYKATGVLVGFMTLAVNPSQGVVSVNACIGDKTFQGKKVVTEISPGLKEFVFESLGMEKVSAIIRGFNLASITTARALGLKKEAHQKNHIVSVKGGRTDVFHYGLLKSEWQTQTQN